MDVLNTSSLDNHQTENVIHEFCFVLLSDFIFEIFFLVSVHTHTHTHI